MPKERDANNGFNTELNLKIMGNIHDFKSLKSLVHASPAMHPIYFTARQKILNQVTFDEMRRRGIDIATASPLIEVCGEMGYSNDLGTLRAVLRKLWYSHIITTNFQGPVLLEIDECKALLRVEEIIRWDDDDSMMWLLPDEDFPSECDDWNYWPADDQDDRHHLILVDELTALQCMETSSLRRSKMGRRFFAKEHHEWWETETSEWFGEGLLTKPGPWLTPFSW